MKNNDDNGYRDGDGNPDGQHDTNRARSSRRNRLHLCRTDDHRGTCRARRVDLRSKNRRRRRGRLRRSSKDWCRLCRGSVLAPPLVELFRRELLFAGKQAANVLSDDSQLGGLNCLPQNLRSIGGGFTPDAENAVKVSPEEGQHSGRYVVAATRLELVRQDRFCLRYRRRDRETSGR